MTTDYAVAIEPHFVKNFWPGRDGYMPMAIVEHMMQGTIEETWSYFMGREGNFGVSAHYGIARDGRIWQFVRDEDTAWANGVLNKPDTSIDWLKEVNEEGVNANLVTLAIEYEGYSGESLTEAQYQSALLLHRRLLERWEIPATADHILGHDRFDSVDRKLNPGPAFPWARLVQELNPSAANIAPPVQSEVVLTGYTAEATTFAGPVPQSMPEITEAWTMPVHAENVISEPEAVQTWIMPPAETEIEPEVTETWTLPPLEIENWTLPPLEEENEPSIIEIAPEPEVARSEVAPEAVEMQTTPQTEAEIEPLELENWTLPPLELDELNESEVAETTATKADEVEIEPEVAEVWSMPAPVEELVEPEIAEVWAEPAPVEEVNVVEPEVEEELPLPTPVSPNLADLLLEEELEKPLSFSFDKPATTNSQSVGERDFLAELDNPGFDQELPADLKDEQLPALSEVMTAQPDLPDFNDFDSLFDEIADFNYKSTQPAEIKPFEVEGAPRSSAPLTFATPKEEPELTPAPPPDDVSGLIYASISKGTVSAELANIRRRPSYDPSTVMRTAEKDTQFQFDGYREGPELQGSTRWFHIAPVDGHGWIHSVLVRLEQPFNPLE